MMSDGGNGFAGLLRPVAHPPSKCLPRTSFYPTCAMCFRATGVPTAVPSDPVRNIDEGRRQILARNQVECESCARLAFVHFSFHSSRAQREKDIAMDGEKFDSLTRALVSGIDRRRLLKLFGGAAVAGAASVTVVNSHSVSAQGAGPGGECTTNEDCAQGSCYVETQGQPGVCYCTDPSRPVIGCSCDGEDGSSCYGTTAVCCSGTCASGSTGCNPTGECSALQTMCESTGCCAEGTTCGANGWCSACYSGTEDPCGPYNEAFGADYICCTYGDNTPGAVGYCVSEAECVVSPPNTGAGSTSEHANWIAPAAAVGVAAAILAYKNRDQTPDTEA